MFLTRYAFAICGLFVVLGATWTHGYVHGKGAERQGWEQKVREAEKQRIQSYEDELTLYNTRAIEDANAAAKLTAELEGIRADRDRLLASPITLTKVKEVPVNVQGKCDQSVLTDAFGVCFEAAVTGEPAAAGACQAAGSNAGSITGASF